MATKTWVPTVAGAWNTTTNWNLSTLPVAGDDVYFNTNIASDAAGVVTLSTTNAQPGAIKFADPTATFYPWQLTGSANIVTFGTGTSVYVDYAPSFIWNTISGNSALIVTASSYSNYLALSGTANTYTGGTAILSGALRIAADTSLGAVPTSLSASNIIFNNLATLIYPNVISHVIPANRGIYLSGSGVISSSYAGAPTFYVHSPVTGTGQIIFDNYIASGSASGLNTVVYLTGTYSYLSNSGGIRLDSTFYNYLYTSGSRNIGSASIEFRNKGTSTGGAGSYLYFLQDSSTQIHTMSGDVSWTGTAGTGAKIISSLAGTITQPQTHVYTGRLITQPGNTSPVYLGYNAASGFDRLLTVKLSGNNNSLYGVIYPGYYSNASIHFIGSSSLPNSNAQMIGYYPSTYATASNSANWIFSGSMTVPNALNTAYLASSSGIGTKLNVSSGSIVTATGIHTLSGPLYRWINGANLAWSATSIVGPGEWVQSGTLTGAGALVVEPIARLTIANNSNTFAGGLVNSGTLTIGTGSGTATQALGFGTVVLAAGSTLASSASVANISNTLVSTGTVTVDVLNATTLTALVQAQGNATTINKIGLGTFRYVVSPNVNVNQVAGVATGVSALTSVLTASADSDFGSIPASYDSLFFPLSGSNWLITNSFTSNANRGFLLLKDWNIAINSSTTFAIGAPVNGTYPVIKTGSGNLQLNNSFITAIKHTSGNLILSGATASDVGVRRSFELSGSNLIISGTTFIGSNRDITTNGDLSIDVDAGAFLYVSSSLSSSIASASFIKTGAGRVYLPDLSTTNFNRSFTVSSGSVVLTTETSTGPVPATLSTASIVLNNSATLIYTNPILGGHAIPANRGIYLSGSGVISSSYIGSPTFYVNSPVMGTGQIVFDNYISSGSVTAVSTFVYLTGTYSYLSNSGGIRIDSTSYGYLYSSGSRNIGSASIEFRNKGIYVGAGGSDFYFLQDPSTQIHTMSGDVSWTGATGTGAKSISRMIGNVTQPQTHIYSGRLITQPGNTSIVYLGYNNASTGLDRLLTVKLTGDNSGLYGQIFPSYGGNNSIHFIGSSSLPNSIAQMIGYYASAYTTASNSANWIFSGSMTVANQIESSNYGANGVGAKMNVAAGSTIIATGRHGLTGTLIRQGTSPVIAWNATSFVGTGEWIQSGTLAGAGALVVEPGSRLTLANNSNISTGPISASNSVVTIAANGGTNSFGATPGSPTTSLYLNNATLAVSSSFSFGNTRRLQIDAGVATFDIPTGMTLTVPQGLDLGWTGASLRIIGGGTLTTPRVPYLNTGSVAGWTSRAVYGDADFGALPASVDPSNITFPLGISDIYTNNVQTFIISGTRGINLQGDGIFSSSIAAAPAPNYYVDSTVTGSGQIIFNNGVASGSATVVDTAVYLIGANSALNNAGGIRIDATGFATLTTSGSRTMGSGTVEFRNKGLASGLVGTSYLGFFQDPAKTTDTIINDIKFTGPSGGATSHKHIAYMRGALTTPQTYIFSGRLTNQVDSTSNFSLGSIGGLTSGFDRLINVVLTGNNSGLYGPIWVGDSGNISVTFVGSQSLPHPSAMLRAVHVNTYTTASNSANWIFSGSMTVPNLIESSNNGTVGAKLNVPSGNTVIHTGRHGLTGSLTRQGSGANFAWSATSFVGPGEWIQSGTLAGAGGLVIEPGACVTFANASNTFAGGLINSGTLTIGAGLTSGTLGTGQINLVDGSTLNISSSLILNPSKLYMTGTINLNISSGSIVSLALGSYVAGTSATINKRGPGTFEYVTSSGVTFNVLEGTVDVKSGSSNIVTASADSSFGATPSVLNPIYFVLSGSSWRITDTFSINQNRGIVLNADSTISVDQNKTLSILAPVTGTSALVKTGGGNLSLVGLSTQNSIYSTSGSLILSGVDTSADQATAVRSIQLTGSNLVVSGTTFLSVNRRLQTDGNLNVDTSVGAFLYVSSSVSSSIASASFTKTGGGRVYLPDLSTTNFKGLFTVSSGSVVLAAETSAGPVPATLSTASITLNNSATLIYPNATSHVIPATRGIYLSGAGIFSSSYTAAPTYHMLSPVTGTGQLIFDNYIASGSATAISTYVYLTGTNSGINNTRGIRIDSTNVGYLYVSGSRTIGSASIEFRNKGTYSAGAGNYLYFMITPGVQVHTMSGDISWTGAKGTGVRYLSYLNGTFTQPQTHIYSGRLSSQSGSINTTYIGYSSTAVNSGLSTFNIKFTGNNSNLYGFIYPAYYYNAAMTFVGSQSLPNSGSQLRGYHYSTYTTASSAANWIFSGSMTVPNSLESSYYGSTVGIGAKLNVPTGNTVIHTGRHGLTGSLTRYGAGTALAWSATSFVGPGEWIQSGTLAGAGSVVIEPSSRLTIANNSNLFTGFITASNSVLTIAANGSDNSFGATPGTAQARLFLQNATLASSASLTLSTTRNVGLTGSVTFDVQSGKTFIIPSQVAGTANITMKGGGLLILSGSTNVTGSVNVLTGTVRFENTFAIPSGSITVQNSGSVILPSSVNKFGTGNLNLILSGGNVSFI